MKSYIALGFGSNFFYALGSDALPIPSKLLYDNDDDDKDDENDNNDEETVDPDKKNDDPIVSLLPLNPNEPPPPPSTSTNLQQWLQSKSNTSHSSPTLPILTCGTTHTTFVLPSAKNSQAHILGTIFGHVHPKPSPQPTRLPLKIHRLASGRRHILALTEGCQKGGGVLLSWGAGHFGQLGHGPELTSSLEPRIVERLLPQSCGGHIVDIAAGGLHSLAIVAIEGGHQKTTLDGRTIRETKTFAWGSNRKSQCGIEGGKCATVPSPMPVVLVKREGRKSGGGTEEKVDMVVNFESVRGGRLHSVGLTGYGEVFTWGSTSMGRCGQSVNSNPRSGDRRICQDPRYVSALRNVVIESIEAGDAHTLALSKNGRVFAWGAGGDGQCGQGHIGNLFTPKSVREVYFEEEEKNSDESGTDTEKKVEPNVKVESEVAMEEELLTHDIGAARAEKRIVRIRAAGCYSAAISSSGDVYTWGFGGGVALGHPVPRNQTDLPMLPLIEGNQYSYATSAKVYPEGCSEADHVRDCVSFDTELNVLMPRRVEVVKKLGLQVEDLSLGPGHMVVICSMPGSSDDNGTEHSTEDQSTIETSDTNNQESDNDYVSDDLGQTDSTELTEARLNEGVNTENVANMSMSMASTAEAASHTTYDSVESSSNTKPERRRQSSFLSKMKLSRSSRSQMSASNEIAPRESTTPPMGEKRKSFRQVGKLLDAAFHRNGGK